MVLLYGASAPAMKCPGLTSRMLLRASGTEMWYGAIEMGHGATRCTFRGMRPLPGADIGRDFRRQRRRLLKKHALLL
eukprot:2492114-Rhodomonas_salina.1